MGNCMCRNSHQPDTNEFRTLTPRRFSQTELAAPVSNPEPLHRRAQSSFSTNLTCSLEAKSLPVSPDLSSPDIAEVTATLNCISVKLEQNAERDDRKPHPGRIRKLIQHTQKISSKLATMQKVQTELQGGNTCRSSVESRTSIGRMEEELERQMMQIRAEMGKVMGEVEELERQTKALSSK